MFKTNLYEVVREAVSPDLLSNLDTQFELIKKLEYLRTGKDESDLYAFADTQISKSFSYYSALY